MALSSPKRVVRRHRSGRVVESLERRALLAADPATFEFAAQHYATAESSGSSSAVAVPIEIIRLGDSTQFQTLYLSTADGTATYAGDYQREVARAIPINPGLRSVTVPVTVRLDTLAEADETFELRLFTSNPATTPTPPVSIATVTIYDDDAGQPTAFRFSASSFARGETSQGSPGSIIRTGNASGSAQVYVSARPSTAAADADLPLATPGTDFAQVTDQVVNFPPGQTRVPAIGSAVNDILPEADEVYEVVLATTAGAPAAQQQVVQTTILDDDNGAAAVRASVADVTVYEGDPGPYHYANVTVTLSEPINASMFVPFETVAGTAQLSSDYQITTGSFNFAPMQATATVAIPITYDIVEEPQEQFFVRLGTPSSPQIAVYDGQAKVTILDDDAPRQWFVDDLTFSEGTNISPFGGPAGTTDAVFTVRLSGAPPYDTKTVTATVVMDGTATGSDFPSTPTVIQQTLTLTAGQTQATFVVKVTADPTIEPTETFSVELSNPSPGTSIGDGDATGTIVNDDGQAAITISSVTVDEGTVLPPPAGALPIANHAVFTIRRSRPSPQVSTFQVATEAGTASTDDYMPGGTTLTFQPGETEKTFSVPIVADDDAESDETFSLHAFSAASGTPIATGTATIVDDDHAGVFSIDPVAGPVGEHTGAPVVLTLRRDGANAGESATVDLATADGTALAWYDFEPVRRTVSFAPGETVKTVEVKVLGDSVVEAGGPETFQVVLSSPSDGASIGAPGAQTVSILDEADPAPRVTDVFVSGSAWTSAYRTSLEIAGHGEAAFGYRINPAEQTRTLAWSNLNRVSVRFSEHVFVTAGDLALAGVNVPSYALATTAGSFTYDAVTFTATWTFAQNIPNDKVTITLDADINTGGVTDPAVNALDGEWTNPVAPSISGDTFPSGDGTDGGDFVFDLRVLPGDIDRNDAVNIFDFNVLKPNLNQTGRGVAGGDLNGDGVVNIFDFNDLKTFLGKTAPA